MILRLIVTLMTATLLVCSGLGQATTGWASEGVMVRPDPLSSEIGEGSTDIVDILVENVTDLYGVEFQIAFDPTLVEVVDADPVKPGVQIQPGDFLSPDWILENSVDNDNGTIDYSLCQMSPSEPVSGDGVVAIITWRSRTVGTSPIALTHVLLGAPRGVEIPASTEDGQIIVLSGEAAPTGTPTPTAAPTETPTLIPPTSTPTFTPVPPTFTPSATAVPGTTEPSTATPTLAPASTATPAGVSAPTSVPASAASNTATPAGASAPTSVPASAASNTATPASASAPTSTPVPTTTHVAEGTETALLGETAVQPTSTAASMAAAQPVPAEGQALPSPLTSTPVSPSGSSGIPASSLTYIAGACLLAAVVGVWALWRRKQ